MSVCLSVCLSPLLRLHFSLNVGENVHRSLEPQKKDRVRWGSKSDHSFPNCYPIVCIVNGKVWTHTRNTLDCDQSNYSLRFVFSYIHVPIEFGPTGNSAIRFADRENPTLESNIEWIGWSVTDIMPFEFSKMAAEHYLGFGQTDPLTPKSLP